MKFGKFIKKVGKAYPGDLWPADRDQALAHTLGDGLADFLYEELWETVGDEENEVVDLEEALRVLTAVLEDVNKVIEAVLRMANNERSKL